MFSPKPFHSSAATLQADLPLWRIADPLRLGKSTSQPPQECVTSSVDSGSTFRRILPLNVSTPRTIGLPQRPRSVQRGKGETQTQTQVRSDHNVKNGRQTSQEATVPRFLSRSKPNNQTLPGGGEIGAENLALCRCDRRNILLEFRVLFAVNLDDRYCVFEQSVSLF